MNRTTSAFLLLASLGLAACGSSSSSTSSTSTTKAATPTTKAATPTTAAAVATTKAAAPTTAAASTTKPSTATTKPATATTKPATATTKPATATTAAGSASTSGAVASAAADTVDLKTVGSLGSVLVDGTGRTLYLYTKDTAGQPGTCTGGCATAWPPDVVTATPKAGTGVDATKLGTVKLSDGKLQVTYDGHPLYRYAQDTASGEAKGQKLDSTWYVVDAAGTAVGK